MSEIIAVISVLSVLAGLEIIGGIAKETRKSSGSHINGLDDTSILTLKNSNEGIRPCGRGTSSHGSKSYEKSSEGIVALESRKGRTAASPDMRRGRLARRGRNTPVTGPA